MKIRNGFVSNSSSSSFIVIFPTEPKSVDDVKNFLFDKEDEMYCKDYTVDQVAKTVWGDICDQKKNDYNIILKEFESGHLNIDGAPEYSDFSHITDFSQKVKAYKKANRKFANKVMNKFFNLRKLKLKEIAKENIEESAYIFSYADEDGSYGSALEHGDLFSKLKHIRISKH